ncbi:thiamine-phosphate kinase [Saprospiraceae bacterium]|nr:thiamine-phosphate kinase [Saprospiraceae bacterium]
MDNFKSEFTDVNTLGEFGLIEKLTEDTIKYHTSTIKGIGDDAAIINYGNSYMAVSTDLLIEGIHFDLMYMPLKHLGYKAVIVNLSDIYAMNAVPTQITFSIAISSKFSVEALEELYAGIKEACRIYNIDLVGGDTTSSTKGLSISVTAMGEVKKEKITYRTGAKVGDILCVTGDLGAAYLGLQILEREKQLYLSNPGIKPDMEDQKYLLERQLKPEARKDSVKYFHKEGIVPTSMIDVSDGLASDLMHICKASDVGAYIEEAKIPIKDEAQLMAIKFRLDPATTALNGGEDYELLFTIDEDDLEKIKHMPDVYIIGEITDKKDGLKLHTTGGNIHPLKAQGWNHFEDNADQN